MRRKRQLRDAHTRIGAVDGGRGVRPPKKKLRGDDDKDRMEVTAAVCKYFCLGHTASDIVDCMLKNEGVQLNREEPYQYLSYAAANGWLSYTAPHEHALNEALRRSCGWLTDFDVVHTSVFEDVAVHGAEMLVQMVQRWRLRHPGVEAIEIGFAGGHAMRKVASAFARLLRQPTPDLPEKIVFHAMVSGFDVTDPLTDPNVFCTYFSDFPAMQVEPEFFGLRAPAFITTKQIPELRKAPGIKEAFDVVTNINIVVTSGSCWSDKHSVLHSLMKTSPESLRALVEAGCIGDLLWRPVGPAGPIEIPTETRAMTLMDLNEIQTGIESERLEVLTVLGPCNGCGAEKSEILRAILASRPPLLTHLVVDSLSARALLGIRRGDKARAEEPAGEEDGKPTRRKAPAKKR